MQFSAPPILLFLWVIPALVLLYLWGARKREAILAAFGEAHLLKNLVPAQGPRRRPLKAGMTIAAAGLIVLALAGPRWGYTWETLTRKGVDIIVAVDVSQSMEATDVEPSRLKRASRELQDLLAMLQGDRIGLVAFAGEAFVQCPLTLDYGAFRMFLDYLDPSLIPVPGTAIGDAITRSITAFDPDNTSGRALILITDGEDHMGDPLNAARAAKEAGITIYTIGIGQPEGAPVPAPEGGGFMKTPEGETAISRLDEASLQRVALETGGAYVRSTTGDLDLETIYKQGIRADVEAQDLKSDRQKRWEERFQWPLALALLLLLGESLMGEGRGRRRSEGLA